MNSLDSSNQFAIWDETLVCHCLSSECVHFTRTRIPNYHMKHEALTQSNIETRIFFFAASPRNAYVLTVAVRAYGGLKKPNTLTTLQTNAIRTFPNWLRSIFPFHRRYTNTHVWATETASGRNSRKKKNEIRLYFGANLSSYIKSRRICNIVPASCCCKAQAPTYIIATYNQFINEFNPKIVAWFSVVAVFCLLLLLHFSFAQNVQYSRGIANQR